MNPKRENGESTKRGGEEVVWILLKIREKV